MEMFDVLYGEPPFGPQTFAGKRSLGFLKDGKIRGEIGIWPGRLRNEKYLEIQTIRFSLTLDRV